jgi:hypothetical protein
MSRFFVNRLAQSTVDIDRILNTGAQ